MATERQPTRPAPKVPQPRLADPAPQPKTQRLPGMEHPSTRILQKAGIKTSRGERNLTSRSIPKTAKPPNPMIIVGGIVGVLFLMVLIVAVAATSGGSGRHKPESNKGKEAPATTADALEREALAKCEEGCTLVLKSYDKSEKVGLQRGYTMILEGMSALERVNQMTGRKFDVKRYQETQLMARNKLKGLE